MLRIPQHCSCWGKILLQRPGEASSGDNSKPKVKGLLKAKSPWKRPVHKPHEEMEQFHCKFRGILNKLTPTKFQTLAEQALQLDISTEERLSGCVDMIFTKALKEPHYGIAYANLCKVMSPIKVETLLEDGSTRSTNFRRTLLKKLQHEFEKDKEEDETLEKMTEAIPQAETVEKRQELSDELSVTMTHMRKRSQSTIQFLGELFKLKMLSESIMKECITRLLRSTSDEEALECFGILITTTGKDLDKPEAKKHMDAYLARIADIIKKGKISLRIKFMLQDVQELRDNGWVPPKHQILKKIGVQLKTIEQIHAEAKIEETEDGWLQGSRVSNKEVRKKFDQTKVTGILARRKEKGAMVGSLGPNTALRPGGWKKQPLASTSTPMDKSTRLSRFSTTGSKRMGPKRARMTSEQERELVLAKVAAFVARQEKKPEPKRARMISEQEREIALAKVTAFTARQEKKPGPKRARMTSEQEREIALAKVTAFTARQEKKPAMQKWPEDEPFSKFQGILNKLTPTKFQTLAEQALQLDISTEKRLCGCIDMIFTQVIADTAGIYTIAYANLCKVMSPIKVEILLEDGRTKSINFRRMLLARCQREFEKDEEGEILDKMKEAIAQAETEEKKHELSVKLSVAMTRIRKRSLCNVRFIGEFFKLKMLSESIMKECISRLLRSTSDEKALECFGMLIMITGKELDKPEVKKHMDAWFLRVADIIKKGKISPRIKFMLKDVQELRENGWVPRNVYRVYRIGELKSLKQIHQEAKIEEEKEKEMLQQYESMGQWHI